MSRQDRREKQSPDQLLKWGTYAVVILIIAGGLFFIVRQLTAPMPGTAYQIQGREHITVGASHLPYNSNPPTSGPHYDNAAPWGIYDHELPDEQLIHNLEHGGVWISYDCGKLKQVSWGLVGTVYANEDTLIEASSSSASASTPSAQATSAAQPASSQGCDKLVEQLAGLVKNYKSKVIITPRVKNDAAIALASWGYLQTLNSFDDGGIRAFIVAHKDQGPELVPD